MTRNSDVPLPDAAVPARHLAAVGHDALVVPDAVAAPPPALLDPVDGSPAAAVGLPPGAAVALVSIEPLTAGRLVRLSPAFAALLGGTPADLRGRDLGDFLRRDDPDDDGRLAQVLSGQRARAGGLRQLLTSRGELVDCQYTALTTGPRPDGQAAAIVSVTPLGSELRRDRARDRAAVFAVDAAPYGIAVFDARGRCVQANPSWTALAGAGSGRDAEQALLAMAGDPALVRDAVAAATSGGRRDLTLRGARPDGWPSEIRVVLAPRFDAGATAGFVAYAHEQPPGADAPPPPSGTTVDIDTVGPGVVARTLGVSHSTIRRWIEDGQLDATRTAGGHRRIRRTELRRIAATLTRPGRVLASELPEVPLPVLAGVLERHGAALADAAARATYVPGSPGWFAEPPSARPLAGWAATTARAFAGGRAPAAVSATSVLFAQARDVAGLEECLVFSDRLSALVLHRLQAEPGGPEELRDARTVFAAMRRSLLTLEDDRVRPR